MIRPVTRRAESRGSDGRTGKAGEAGAGAGAGVAAFADESARGFSSLQPTANKRIPNVKKTRRSRVSFLSRTFTIPTKPRVWNRTRCRDAARKRSPLDTFPLESSLGPPFQHESHLPDSRSRRANRTPEFHEGFPLSG